MNLLLWVLQVLLALVFLFAGVTKLRMSAQDLTQQVHLSAAFLRFISVCEILGAAGLILPGLARISPGLTPLAAAGLAVIMVGATVISIKTAPLPLALIPLVTGLLCAFVAYGRWHSAPHPSRKSTVYSK